MRKKNKFRRLSILSIFTFFGIILSSFLLININNTIFLDNGMNNWSKENILEDESFIHEPKFQSLHLSQSEESNSNEVPSSSYVIITTNNIRSNSQILDDFVQFKNACGFKVIILTEDDFGNDTGKARAINIRNWLKNKYQSENIKYVLLIGDPDPDNDDISDDSIGDIPMMMCWPLNNGTGDDYSYEESPTDYFYADLTGDWDSDGDNYYGEFGYGHYENPEDAGVDFAAEVMVGRIPVYNNDYSTLDFILNKTIYHHQSTGMEKYRILEPMAISNYDDEDGIPDYDRVDGRDLPEALWNSTISHLNINDTVLYEASGLNPVDESAFHYSLPLTRNNVINEINSGYGAIIWWGHGSETGAYRKYWDDSKEDGDGIPEKDEMNWLTFLESNDLSSIDSNNSAFIFQISCSNGYPENPNNLGYSLLESGVGISTISSSRVSWYGTAPWEPDFYENYTDNAGLGYAYMHNLLYENMSAGQALAVAKEFGGEDWGGHSWMNKMDFNLYGDPHLKYWSSAVPDIPILQSPLNESIIYSSDVKLTIKVEDLDSPLLNVTFFNASDNSIIGWDLNVPSGQNATIWWKNLTKNTTYQWYAIVSDGQTFQKSSKWSFKIAGNITPIILSVSPINDRREQVDFVELDIGVFDEDHDNLTIRFYNAASDNLLGISDIIGGNGCATFLWDDLLWNSQYSWYFTVEDGHYLVNSSVFVFYTDYLPEIMSVPTPSNGDVFENTKVRLALDIFDEDLSPLTIYFHDNVSHQLLGAVNLTMGNGTAEFLWQGLTYNTNYSWYVEVDDGIVTIQSEIWWFQIGPDPNVDTNSYENGRILEIAAFSPFFIILSFNLGVIIVVYHKLKRD
ncbi:MAG: hypothetical protein DRO88_10105 [Promethearchaeia archaeon]|nr:MAG: hypothetical protein DRO88_10105 [Candidatus Lokiarchaeia archaeon]